MTDEASAYRRSDVFDLGSMFRSSATASFVIQIVAVVVMIGSLTAFAIGDLFFALGDDLKLLLFLIISIVFLAIFLAAISAFVRFSRRIGHMVVGPGIEQVRFDTPRVKAVVVLYGIMVALMAILGIYVWFLVDSYYLAPFAQTFNSISLRIFGLALGAFFIAFLIQIIIAGVGRSATRVIIEVLDSDDDDEFLR